MNNLAHQLESQEKGFSSLCDLILEDDGIAIISLFTLTSHDYGRFPDIVPLARTVPKEKFLASYEQFKQEGYIPKIFQGKLEDYIIHMQDINEEGIEEKNKRGFLKNLEESLKELMYYGNKGFYHEKIPGQPQEEIRLPELRIENGEISFLLDSHKVQENTASAVEEVIILGINQ